jgi:hypothetical protein
VPSQPGRCQSLTGKLIKWKIAVPVGREPILMAVARSGPILSEVSEAGSEVASQQEAKAMHLTGPLMTQPVARAVAEQIHEKARLSRPPATAQAARGLQAFINDRAK